MTRSRLNLRTLMGLILFTTGLGAAGYLVALQTDKLIEQLGYHHGPGYHMAVTLLTPFWACLGTVWGFRLLSRSKTGDISLPILFSFIFTVGVMMVGAAVQHADTPNVGMYNLYRVRDVQAMAGSLRAENPNALDHPDSAFIKTAWVQPTPDNLIAFQRREGSVIRGRYYRQWMSSMALLEMESHPIYRRALTRGWVTSQEVAAIRHLLRSNPPSQRLRNNATAHAYSVLVGG